MLLPHNLSISLEVLPKHMVYFGTFIFHFFIVENVILANRVHGY